MKTVNADELKEILEKHELWLSGEPTGCRANLSCVDLSYVHLRDVNLSNANLYCADLRGAHLHHADLSNAILNDAELSEALISDADLRGASLYGANLSGANMSGAKVDHCKWDHNTAFYSIQCPEVGSFIGWKKAGNKIVKLEITEDALRSSATSRKCRCSKAKVLAIEYLNGNKYGGVVTSNYDKSFTYKVGETIEVSNFDTDRWKECAPGIHFFITRQEAVNY